MKLKIASYNANGIRARQPIILTWIDQHIPDILCIQETKVQDSDFPSAVFQQKGYHCSFKGQKSYNGVAILSRMAPEWVSKGFADGDPADESRLIAAKIGDVIVVNTYVPQGRHPDSEHFEYKIDWLRRLRNYFEKKFEDQTSLVWVGDFNIAPEPIDVYDPETLLGSVCYHPEEHKALSKLKQWGFTDVYRIHHPRERHFTFWDYRIPNALKRGIGWRIDHIWATKMLAEASKTAWIDLEARTMPKPSDHTFLVAEFEI
jgi:exodeoxyribonuclease-3